MLDSCKGSKGVKLLLTLEYLHSMSDAEKHIKKQKKARFSNEIRRILYLKPQWKVRQNEIRSTEKEFLYLKPVSSILYVHQISYEVGKKAMRAAEFVIK